MSKNTEEEWFDLLKNESELKKLSLDHEKLFEKKLNSSKSNLKKYFSIAAVLVLGLFIVGLVKPLSEKNQTVNAEYEVTKSYFQNYVDYEIERTKIGLRDNNVVINQKFIEVGKLQEDFKKMEIDFFNQNYDKRVLKRLINNFRQQLRILESIESISVIEDTKTKI